MSNSWREHMKIGDLVVRKSHGKDVTFKIIDIKESGIYILNGINIRIIADAKEEDLEEVYSDYAGIKDKIFNSRVNDTIKKVLMSRDDLKAINNVSDKKKQSESMSRYVKGGKIEQKKELFFGRPGKVLHVDGDEYYLDACLKVYKQLNIDAEGRCICEKEQPTKIVDIVKEVKPDIVVLTGHDGFVKDANNYLDLNNYRNSSYYIDSVKALREYNPSYDELVIFAGACQSCYESILNAGANYASSPNRVLIHCLDPVFICEKVAYTSIDKVVSMGEILENTITGIEGIGGLQTRGKYREGYPKSKYIQ